MVSIYIILTTDKPCLRLITSVNLHDQDVLRQRKVVADYRLVFLLKNLKVMLVNNESSDLISSGTTGQFNLYFAKERRA